MNENRKLYRFRLVGVLATVGAAIALIGPSWADQSSPRDGASESVNNYDELVAEYREALQDPNLIFPEGISIPDEPNVPGGGADKGGNRRGARESVDEDDMRYQSGYGQLEAANVWRCAWEHDMLNAFNSSDTQGVLDAANELAGWYDLAIVKSSVVDPDEQWYADVVTPALNGNAGNLNVDVNINCDPNIGS